MIATPSLSSVVLHSVSQALSLEARLIVAAFNVQERDKPADLKGWGYVPRALRFDFLPPSAKEDDGLAAIHLLRLARRDASNVDAAPRGPLRPATPEAVPTDLLWVDADGVVRALRITGASIAATRAPGDDWFFRAAVVGTDRVIERPAKLPRRPEAVLRSDAESWQLAGLSSATVAEFV